MSLSHKILEASLPQSDFLLNGEVNIENHTASWELSQGALLNLKYGFEKMRPGEL